MRTYKATVRVTKTGGIGYMYVWAQVTAQSPIAAKLMLEAQYGRGNVLGTAVQVTGTMTEP